MPYITLCALDVICSKYMYSVKYKTATSSNLSASYKHSGLEGGVSEKRDSSFFSLSPPLLPGDVTLTGQIFRNRVCFSLLILCVYTRLDWRSCESAFCRLCFEWCYCNRCLLCTIVAVCSLVIIFFSSSHFNGCVAKRPRRCRLPIRQRSFKVTILKTCSLLKKTCLSLAYGVQSVLIRILIATVNYS